jgi:hypothetical protein
LSDIYSEEFIGFGAQIELGMGMAILLSLFAPGLDSRFRSGGSGLSAGSVRARTSAASFRFPDRSLRSVADRCGTDLAIDRG